MVVTLGVFGTLIALVPGQLVQFQPDYVSPVVRDQEVVDFFDLNNITTYQNTWSFDIAYQTMEFNESGLADGHRIEFFWWNVAPFPSSNPCIYVKHAFPSPLGAWWLWANWMEPLTGYREKAGEFTGVRDASYYMGAEPYLLTKQNIINLQTSENASYFECTDGEITTNFVVMNGNTTAYSNLTASWDGQILHVLSSYEIDWDAMKPNAWWLIAQIVFFQSPDLGIPGVFGDILTYIFALGFWVVIALIIYTVATRMIPTIQGGIEG